MPNANRPLPVVDDADVNRFVEAVLKNRDFIDTPPDERATIGEMLARVMADKEGASREWREELARKVRQRLIWASPSRNE